jgi:hypothetical protein
MKKISRLDSRALNASSSHDLDRETIFRVRGS